MKKTILMSMILGSSLLACKNESTNNAATNEQATTTQNTTSGTSCYQSIMGKDTVSMKLTTTENGAISGELVYNYFEKDRNTGTIKGTMNGDMLVAMYSFMSEGVVSEREVIFLKKGNELIEGFGEVEDKDGKMLFKDKKKIQFTGTEALKQTDCK